MPLPHGDRVSPSPSPPEPGDQIYVIGQSWRSPVTVGVTNRPEDRLRQLQAGSPVNLVLLWSAPGNGLVLEHIQAALATMRAHGQWFDLSPLANPLYLISRLAMEAEKSQEVESRPAETLGEYRKELLAEVAQVERAMRPEVIAAVRAGLPRRAAARRYGLSRETVKAWVASAAEVEATQIRRERTNLLKGLAGR